MKKVIITVKGCKYETSYYVSKSGEIYNDNKKLKQMLNGGGYLSVNLFYEKAKSIICLILIAKEKLTILTAIKLIIEFAILNGVHQKKILPMPLE